MAREITFEVMGTTAQVIVEANRPNLLEHAVETLEACHARWTRFDETSELCQLNRRSGRFTVVSDETYQLIAEAISGWWRSDGRYDPTVIEAISAAGYDRTFDQIEGQAAARTCGRVPGCGEIALLPEAQAVFLPAGVGLDLGGIAKGFAADLVVADLLARGATGVAVSIGGDAAFGGIAPTADGWLIEVAPAERATGEPRTLAVAEGAVCTSSTGRRRWMTDRGPRHHLIDPRTADSVETDIATVTVLAARAVDAEVAAKEAILQSSSCATRTLVSRGLAGVIVTTDGEVIDVGPIGSFAA